MRSRNLLWSFNYAIEGIVYALRTQRNMRLHALAAATVLFAALFFRISALELVAVVFAIGLVVVAELVNTAIEATVDMAILFKGFEQFCNPNSTKEAKIVNPKSETCTVGANRSIRNHAVEKMF